MGAWVLGRPQTRRQVRYVPQEGKAVRCDVLQHAARPRELRVARRALGRGLDGRRASEVAFSSRARTRARTRPGHPALKRARHVRHV